MSHNEKDEVLHFPAFDASPGEGYRKWRQNLYSDAATKTDELGSSLADTLQGVDMGGPLAGAPPIPPGAPGQKMGRLHDGRVKASYALIYKHVSDGDLRTILFTNHFQDGHGAIQYLDTVYDTPTAIKEQYVSHIRVRSAAITSLATFTGVNIVRDRERGTLTISQGTYIDQLAERYQGQFQQRNTPDPTSQTARCEFDKQEAGRADDANAVDRVSFICVS